LEHLSTWCRLYQLEGPWPVDGARRFAIGVYQIGQALEWDDASVVLPAAQSWCAAVMHFTCAGHAFGVDALARLGERLDDLGEPGSAREVLLWLSKAQQMIVYAAQTNARWVSRFSLEALQGRLEALIESCLAHVPAQLREEACFAEMGILTRDIK
jgi:hypothetical protein